MTETPVVASNGFVVWAPTMQADPSRPDCERHASGDPDYPCVCPEATEVDVAACVTAGTHFEVITDLGNCAGCGLPVAERLEYLRGEIRAERISYGELAELQGLAEHIDRDDVELLEWAGVPEDAR